MSDLDKLHADWRSFIAAAPGNDAWAIAMNAKADALIAALETALDTLGHDYIEAVESARNDWREKCQQAEAEVERLDALLKLACQKWAACCDPSVLFPPRIASGFDGYRWLLEQDDAEVKP